MMKRMLSLAEAVFEKQELCRGKKNMFSPNLVMDTIDKLDYVWRSGASRGRFME